MTTLEKITMWCGILFLSAAGAACSGTSDESEEGLRPELSPSVRTIDADGTDAVKFTVKSGPLDVTAQSAIRCTTTDKQLSGASFSTTTPGSYVFEAVYNGQTSDPVTVTAQAVTSEESQYVRKVCLMEFTGQWCSLCPEGGRALSSILDLQYNTGGKHPVYVLALHGDSGGADNLALNVTREIANTFGNPGFPAYLIDLRVVGPLNKEREKLYTALNECLGYTERDEEGHKIQIPPKYPAHCGVAVKSVYDPTSGKASVSVKIASEKTGQYRLALWVVEDGIKGPQKDGSKEIEDYIHNHVARRLVSASYKGDPMGEIASGAEQTKSYEIPVDAAWNLDKTQLYTLAIDDQGYVNNMAVCAFANGDTDYDKVN